MFQIRILLTLLSHPFSLEKDNLRFISIRRAIVVLLIYPSFLLHLMFNWLFLVLDELIFPKYRKTPADRVAFIIGVPRSATTYLFHRLAEDRRHFHAFPLWELIFAPSICQKYIYLGWGKLSSKMGYPVRSLIRLIDRSFISGKKLSTIHTTGLFLPEEDEMLFLWNLSSAFYYFFFPQTPTLQKLLYHDRDLPEKIKRANLRYYKNCIRRHNYVFDRNNERYYLSKNPTFTPKLASVVEAFPGARFIYPLRSPLDTIPSTISLMAANYSKFCRMPEKYPLRNETRDLLIDWYLYAHEVLTKQIGENGLTVLYPEIKSDPVKVFRQLYAFLELPEPDVIIREIEEGKRKKRTHRSMHRYDDTLGIDRALIREKLAHIMPAEIKL
jgi:hypothetical protein